jgi:phosphatidylserine decarboxylase
MLSLGPLKGRIHPAGFPFISACLVVAAGLFFISLSWFLLALILVLCVAAFFREPLRVPFDTRDVVLSPADGIVVAVTQDARAPNEVGPHAEGAWMRVSIFLSVFDVHVTRAPAAGRVLLVAYKKGRFFNASLDKASEMNERNSIVLEIKEGTKLLVTQIAGLIARRIVCDVKNGDMVGTGDTYGIIRFGSRVDLYVPSDTEVMVKTGQKMVGGETVVARLRSDDTPGA